MSSCDGFLALPCVRLFTALIVIAFSKLHTCIKTAVRALAKILQRTAVLTVLQAHRAERAW